MEDKKIEIDKAFKQLMSPYPLTKEIYKYTSDDIWKSTTSVTKPSTMDSVAKEDYESEIFSNQWIEIETNTENSFLRKSEIERIYERKFEDRIEVYIRTKSGDSIQTKFSTLVEAKQMCL